MVYDCQVVADRTKLLATVIATPEILKSKILLDQPPKIVSVVTSESNNAPPANVEFASYGTNRVVLTVDAPRAGFLVMSNLNANSWKAKMDGSPVPVLNANYDYRAVSLPTGQHQVEFYYQPASFTVGTVLNLFGLLILLGLWLFMRFIPVRTSAGSVRGD